MKIGPYEFPDGLYYDREHNWARVEGETLTQGISDFGQAIAGEIIYAEAPRVGREVKQGEAFMSLESGKWVGRIRAVAGGTISAANEDLEFDSALVNTDPYGAGWLAKIAVADAGELTPLMRAGDAAFAEFIAAERAKYGK
ncbi:MAG TPA: glycine cleavage system protein H [Anaerolineae bacterium]|nr:glycine cleavage system protein H [Anaerolineae bacterium]HOQ97476.1 glycine cleavage system protein H [Anaerolineae bacterium]HPL29648.1 glycine cleavage system protein H [Anaerolineae bacterium]